MKNCNEESNVGYFLEVDVQYLQKLHELRNDLPFLPDKMKIEKVEYVINIGKLKQALNHGLVLKKVHGVIKFNQNAWLKPCTDINTDLKKEQKFIINKIVLG